MVLRKTFNFKKKRSKCRRNTITTLNQHRNAPIQDVGEAIIYKGRKLTIDRVFAHAKAGNCVAYSAKNGDEGVCLAHYWWDKVKEAQEDEQSKAT